MEELLRELLSVNKEMLNELRMLRQSLCHDAEVSRPVAQATEEPDTLFGQPDPGRTPPPRYSPKDLEDIRGSLMEGVKKRNKEKSNAFAEFEKRHKDW